MSSDRILLFTDRPDFTATWSAPCSELGLGVETYSPNELNHSLEEGALIVIDGESPVYDEDELVTAVGVASASGAHVAVFRTSELRWAGEIIDEICPARVARRAEDVPRVCHQLVRRLDAARPSRFEYMTLQSPGGALLAIFGDGRSVLLPRPLVSTDMGGEVETIEMLEDGRRAKILLAGGQELELWAWDVAHASANSDSNGASTVELDGVALGKRIRKLRMEAGLTQAEVARRTGIHRPNIARVEAGRHRPSLETLAKLASAIGVAPSRMLYQD